MGQQRSANGAFATCRASAAPRRPTPSVRKWSSCADKNQWLSCHVLQWQVAAGGQRVADQLVAAIAAVRLDTAHRALLATAPFPAEVAGEFGRRLAGRLAASALVGVPAAALKLPAGAPCRGLRGPCTQRRRQGTADETCQDRAPRRTHRQCPCHPVKSVAVHAAILLSYLPRGRAPFGSVAIAPANARGTQYSKP